MAPERSLLAERSGDGWLVSGSAPGVVNGGLADLLLTVASTASQDMVLVVIQGERPGIARDPGPELVGPRVCNWADLRFERAEVPSTAVLNDGEEAEAPLGELQLAQQLSLAVVALAGARAAVALTLDYVQQRRAFGQLIAAFQNTRYALADVVAEIELTEMFVDACVREHAAGRLTQRRAAAAKLRSSELYGRAVDCGVQLHGGYGYMLEYPIAHAYADARFLRLHGGTSEAMKEIVAASMDL